MFQLTVPIVITYVVTPCNITFKKAEEAYSYYVVPATDESELYSQLKDITVLDLLRDSIK